MSAGISGYPMTGYLINPPGQKAVKVGSRPLSTGTVTHGSTTKLSIQGLVYLTDTNIEQGAFSCVPGHLPEPARLSEATQR